MSIKAPDLTLVNTNGIDNTSLLITEHLSWHSVALFLAIVLALGISIWALLSARKHRADVSKAGKSKQVLKVFAIILLVIGCVNFYMSIREAYAICAFVNGSDAKKAMFDNYLSSGLRTLLISAVVSGIMFLLSITMPWNRKAKGIGGKLS